MEKHIAIDAQHLAYFPDDEPTRMRLSQDLASVASGYDLVTCTACGLTFAWPMIAPLSSWYELAYRKWNLKPDERWEYPVVLKELAPDDCVYEIGCGLGVFLAHCKRRRVPAFGIDFSEESVAACRRRGLDAATIDVGMQTVAAASRPASVVVSCQVLEHLAQPDALFRLASNVAADAAVLWISVPNSSRISRVLEITEPVDEPPHHLTKWTEKALQAVGARNGWELEAVLRQPFSWRAALYIVAADSSIYRRLRSAGWFRVSRLESAVRMLIYPFAYFSLRANPDRTRMEGLTMIARYRLRARLAAAPATES